MSLEIILQWISNVTQDQVFAYAPIFALIATIGIFTYSQYLKKRIESAQLSLDLNKRMYDETIRKTRTSIYNAMDLKKDLEILEAGTIASNDENITIQERDIDEYLNVLEEIGLFVNKKVLDKDFAYEMFGFQIRTIYDFKFIKTYMEEQRKKQGQGDLWSQLEKSYKKIIKIKNKKNKMVTNLSNDLTVNYILKIIK